MRTLIQYLPFTQCDAGQEWHMKGLWPYRWIQGSDLGDAPFAVAYRNSFVIEKDVTVRVHVSGDERYELYLDGNVIGRGSERGDQANWYYETYDLKLTAGKHSIVAKVWSLGPMAPFAQMSVKHGFIFAPEGDLGSLLGTGVAKWEYRKISGLQFTDPRPAFGTGANLVIDGQNFPWGFERGQGDGWKDATAAHQGTNGVYRNEIGAQHLMRPAVLPPMLEQEVHGGKVRFVASYEAVNTLREKAIRATDNLPAEVKNWDLLNSASPVVVPANTKRRVIIDLDGYFCAYPQLITSGGKGATISLQWAESLFIESAAKTKGNRDEIEGKYFFGVGDVFHPDGGKDRKFETLWWQPGRYLQLCVETGTEPLTIERLALRETRYPLEMESKFTCDDDRLNDVVPLGFRSLQLCSHETFIDCPYYEQLMYSGDSRLKSLAAMIATREGPFLRKCIDIFDYSRTFTGLTQSRYPSRVRQILAPFSLFWVGMVHDYALWRGEKEFIAKQMRGVRSVLEWYLGTLNRDGLVECHEGWNFMDWVPSWTDGVHPGMEYGPSGIMNLQYVYVLTLAARVEEWLGEAELANRWKRIASQIASRVQEKFWDEGRGLFADDVRKKYFSEHAQCFAVLSGLFPAEVQSRIGEGLRGADDLARTTISFNHYLFETYRALDCMDLFFQRMQTWFDLKKIGLRTTPEQPEPTRSDCHGWGAHPIYHFFASVLGVRPAEMGFARVEISPQLGSLKHAAGKLVHPKGLIDIALRKEAETLIGDVTLPAGVSGCVRFAGTTTELKSGERSHIEIAPHRNGNILSGEDNAEEMVGGLDRI